MNFESVPEFKKDLKDLSKKYRSLPEDMAVIQKVLSVSPDERPPFSFRIDGLGIETCVIKIKKIACRSLKGKGVNSGFRLIYALFKKESKIIFIELYHKNDKDNEDRERIFHHFK